MAAAAIEIRGLKELLARMDERLYAEPLRKGLDDAAHVGAERVRSAGPAGPGNRLRALATSKVQPTPVPRWAVFKTDAVDQRGRSYPAMIAGPRLRGRPSKHAGWMRAIGRAVQGQLESILQSASREIERRWQRR